MTSARNMRAGLLGRGIQASSSPAIHEREAAAMGVDLRYRLYDFDVLGLADADLEHRLDQLAQDGLAGVNLTHPFKQAVLPLLHEVEDTARALGAVNCVAFRDGRKIGFNSDCEGFGFLLDHDLPGVALGRVAQIGAGGAGSATAYALLAAGVQEIRLCDSAPDRAHGLADRMALLFPDATVTVSSDAASAIVGADGVVQATPIGMVAHPGLPFDPDLIQPGQWLADIIYFPRETELIRAAKRQGVRAVGGSAMVVGQAVEPLRRFTGSAPNGQRMLADFLAADEATKASRA